MCFYYICNDNDIKNIIMEKDNLQEKKSRKFLYYLATIVLFLVCMFIVIFIMSGVEYFLKIHLGSVVQTVGFLVGLGLFTALKPIVKKIIR